MPEIYKTYKHTPAHLFRPHAKYFITGATLNKVQYFKSCESKQAAIEYMFKSFDHYGWIIEDWVFLNNHYHIMADAPENPETLSQVINNFHRFSALKLKKLHPEFADVEHVWYNYWDTCITYEKSYFARINYIWFNPVKHKYVTEAENWKYGSFFERAKEWKNVKGIVEQYPFEKLNIDDDF
ncbi:MAG: transposase [bacterium]|nr:transposase [bacterium]